MAIKAGLKHSVSFSATMTSRPSCCYQKICVGAVTDDEWLFVNGSQWQDIDEVLIYSFIYEGSDNWQGSMPLSPSISPDSFLSVPRWLMEANGTMSRR
jgi:hypothetical protein